MIQWFIDKNNKVPLYLQLKDLIKYYISTGAIQADHQLPALNALAKDLGINFETVRKAYKELEKEGLLSMKRGHGTHVILHNVPQGAAKTSLSAEDGLLGMAKSTFRRYLQQGTSLAEAKRIIGQALAEVSVERSEQEIIFTECNTLQIKEISELLRSYLDRPIKPVLIKDLKKEMQKVSADAGRPLDIITTGFHIDEVRTTARNTAVSIHVLITQMSSETRRKLDAFGKKARLGFICRDEESILFYKDVLKAELDNPKLELTCAISSEKSKVKAMFKSVDILLVSPPVYEEIKSIAPAKLPVFNLFEQVAPMSLKIIKDSILAAEGQSGGRLASPSNRSS